ncbi:hypothetical protein PARPLA_01000 [Rhodobacteraceae bacterium THAF1]|uniref:DUF4864 domain-containing protein n=1 Tax=Palleronia sp. THAF1 TaxID=2587842 RepID=UPI000F3B8C8F|nr:DUF4864 domain-containing protein [Palleronia sp. THAF1]QFU07536.1 hypothetical protein FIU81_02475 [Palleronia sp. THAF1]VDC20499.1 hypothetical protein PARPLA_01000 [Rhodobacteraceae bacterium THAF1]
MRPFIAAIALCLAALPAAAQEAEIEGVISSQLEAFQSDDFGQAFSYASPMIQGMFRTPQNFGSMVQQGYPMVHRPGAVTYLELEGEPPLMRQKVMIQDASGAFHTLEYEMLQDGDAWLINGVQMLSAPAVGV